MLSRHKIIQNPLRPLLKPPSLNSVADPLHLRFFTRESPLILTCASASLRPRWPLVQNLSARCTLITKDQFQAQTLRLLTTESRDSAKHRVKTFMKYTAYLWTFLLLGGLMYLGLDQEALERKYPSPPEWSWLTKLIYRNARAEEGAHNSPSGIVNWMRVGNHNSSLIARLEDPSKEGEGLRPRLGDGEDIRVEGVGKTGFDITIKSEPWRRAYYTTLMAAARAAEHLDNWVRDKTRWMVFPPEVVVGPSNPRPKPVPYGMKKAPLEENCEPAFDLPQTYYLKILTTEGFTTRQRLTAALAYADWLNYKGLPSSAEDMYDWGIDIAVAALPVGVDNVVDTKTGTINEFATYITPNILVAASALATHHAKQNNLSAALPVFLSVLRAQRSLPKSSASITAPLQLPPFSGSANLSTLNTAVSFLRTIFYTPSYPSPPPTGDEPAFSTPTTTCEEAGTMAHIGEILFTSSSSTISQFSGLAWTRSAVSLAEKTLLALPTVPSKLPTNAAKAADEEARTRCSECLLSGTENWVAMVAAMQRAEEEKRTKGAGSPNVKGEKQTGWFWSSEAKDEVKGVDVGERKWEREAKVVEERRKEVRRLVRQMGAGIEVAGAGAGGILHQIDRSWALLRS